MDFERTRTCGTIGLGERNYKNGKLVLFIKVDFFIWKVGVLIKLIGYLLWNVFRKEEREMVVTGVFHNPIMRRFEFKLIIIFIYYYGY